MTGSGGQQPARPDSEIAGPRVRLVAVRILYCDKAATLNGDIEITTGICGRALRQVRAIGFSDCIDARRLKQFKIQENQMNQALWVAKTWLDAQQTRMAVISNNLANVNTTGFKQGRAVFEDLLYQNVRQSGGQSSQDTLLPSGMSLGTGVRIVATEKLFTQGSVLQSNNPLDVAIKGRGFFQILLPDGNIAYSRDGTFQRNSQGELVTALKR